MNRAENQQEEPGSRSRTSRAGPDTTTTTDELEIAAANLLTEYHETITDDLRQPPPWPEPEWSEADHAAARKLSSEGVRAYDPLDTARDESADAPFGSVISWGLRDSYSRPRLAGSFAAAAKCYWPLAAKFKAAPRIDCANPSRDPDCEGEFVLTEEEAKRHERLGWERAGLMCPTCRHEESEAEKRAMEWIRNEREQQAASEEDAA